MSISPVRLNHAVLFVADLDRALTFYTERLRDAGRGSRASRQCGFPPTPAVGKPSRPRPVRTRPATPLRSRHEASACTTWPGRSTRSTSSREARQSLLDSGAYTGESSHGATKSIYGADPDGNEFEVMWMLPRDAWGEFEHTATVEPLDLERELADWGGRAPQSPSRR